MLVPKTLLKKLLGILLQKENHSFTLCVVNPVYVFVPHAFDIKIITELLQVECTDTFANLTGSIDVRNVAKELTLLL